MLRPTGSIDMALNDQRNGVTSSEFDPGADHVINSIGETKPARLASESLAAKNTGVRHFILSELF